MSGGYPLVECAGFLLQWLLLWSSGSIMCRLQQLRHLASVVMVHWLNCSAACGNLSWPETDPVFPAFQGRFLTTGPPRKHQNGPLSGGHHLYIPLTSWGGVSGPCLASPVNWLEQELVSLEGRLEPQTIKEFRAEQHSSGLYLFYSM